MHATPVNHVFLDFENVQQFDLAAFGGRVVKFNLFLGEKQKKLDADTVAQLLEHAAHVQLVRLSSSGKNALDFTLTYYLGRAVCSDPTGFFHVVSKDKGFDPLIEHLRHQRIRVARHNSFADVVTQVIKPRPAETTRASLPGTMPAREEVHPPPSPPNPRRTLISTDEAWAHIKRNAAHRPKRRETLHALLKNHFHLGEPEATDLITDLAHRARIAIDGRGKVSYQL